MAYYKRRKATICYIAYVNLQVFRLKYCNPLLLADDSQPQRVHKAPAQLILEAAMKDAVQLQWSIQ